jgi:hypothetical protein
VGVGDSSFLARRLPKWKTATALRHERGSGRWQAGTTHPRPDGEKGGLGQNRPIGLDWEEI